jgi:hypothetical protein
MYVACSDFMHAAAIEAALLAYPGTESAANAFLSLHIMC